MSLPYCERYKFDDSKIEERLHQLQLGEEDHIVATRLQKDIIQPNAAKIIKEFYHWLLSLDEARSILVDDELIARLQLSQQQYLVTLGVGFNQLDYFEARLRVGQAHVWVGLSLSLYQCAYRFMGQLIHDCIDLKRDDAPELIKFIHKIIALDMSLAIDTYHLAQVDSLEESLDHAKRQQLRLRLEACTDSLTGVANHETIVAQLTEILRRSSVPKLVVAMVDIDFFKRVNDTHGHVVGDKVLSEVTRRMRAALRDVDSIGRYGGEEFLVLMNGSNMNVARRIAERIRVHVAEQPINLQGLEVPVTLSLGLAEAQPNESAESVIERADQAMYKAKEAGRDQVQVSD